MICTRHLPPSIDIKSPVSASATVSSNGGDSVLSGIECR